MTIDRRFLPLAFGAFVVATDGTVIVGLLRQVASSVAVSPAAAGQALTVFGAVYALGAPLLVRAARRVQARWLLVGSLGGFALANAATGAAQSLPALIGARAAAAACAGVFMATAAAVAAGTATPERRGRALAVLVGGSSAGTALGVPIGTLLGGALGWRAIFYGIAVLTAAVTVLATRLPATGSQAQPPRQTAGGRARGIALTLATTLLWATGSFTFFTYIAIILHHTASVGTAGVAAFLFLFGLAGVAGAAFAGAFTDAKGPLVTLAAALALVTASLAGLGLTAALASGSIAAAASVASIAGYAIGTWAITPPQQHRLLTQGGDQRLLLSLNASALYAGVALGSATGGLTLAASGSPSVTCFVAAAIEMSAFTLVTLTRRRSAAGVQLSSP